MTSAEKPTNRNIPLPMQRAIRQRCGFGCVVCGMPLYEYDHLLGWAEVERHEPEEITLLCDTHHREKTSGLLPQEDVLEANANPYNLREGVSKPYDLHYAGDECEIVIGSNRFTTRDQGYGTAIIPVAIDGAPMVGFILADGHLLLNLLIFDENNDLVLQIKNNQLFYSVEPWDIEFIGRNLIVREAKRKFLVDITFTPPNRVQIDRGLFLRNGVELLIRPDHLLLVNSRGLFSGNTVVNCTGGIIIGEHPEPISAAIRIPQVSRYLGDRSEAEKWAREVMGQSEKREA